MLVNRNFIISANSTDFPEEIWDMKLGNDVYHVRYNEPEPPGGHRAGNVVTCTMTPRLVHTDGYPAGSKRC
jgi:hypothetical protein